MRQATSLGALSAILLSAIIRCGALPAVPAASPMVAAPSSSLAMPSSARPGSALAPLARLRGGSDAAFAAAAMNPEAAKQLMSSGLISQPRKIGLGLIAAGLVMSFLGFMLFLNRTLIGTGNLFIISGIVLVVGWQKSKDFMFQKQRTRGTSIFLLGVFLVLRGWARLGVLVELFGILNLFGNFIPSLVNLIKKLPVVGPLVAPVLESPMAEKVMAAATSMGPKGETASSTATAPPPAGGGPPPAAAAPQGKKEGTDWASVLRKGVRSAMGRKGDEDSSSPPPPDSAPGYGGGGYGSGAPPPAAGGYGAPPPQAGYGYQQGVTDWASRPPPTASGHGAWSTGATSQKEHLEKLSRDMNY